ncbi:transporter substrate-binding domain-containing protein [Metaclostridioides mangenotii]|uniref:transporter substrate-binding domain-containing protein n=1 Tax=Metaclostridioides mangenotii TaxID=1540 RepID=UPI000463DDDC|nr:transporter substrate-binding domain-containing protein [Clostridioides mangenotii]
MNLRKFGILCLVGIILTGMIGCSKSNNANQKDSKKEKIVIGTSASYKPWAFQENDKIKGFEIDIWNEIAKRNNLDVEFKLGQFSGLVGMLDANEIDTVAHQMSITEERKEKYLFSEPYAYSYYDFFVKDDSDFNNKEDLRGKKVGCWLGGNGEATLREINDKYNLGFDIVTYDGVAMEKELIIDRIDALWQGEIKTKTIIKDENLKVRQLNEKMVYEINAYPFKKDDKGQKFTELSSKTLDSMRKDGTLKKLSEKWFDTDTTEVEK